MSDRFNFSDILFREPQPEAPQLIIYSSKLSARLKYVCDFIFKTVLQLNYEITNERNVFNLSAKYRINYSNEQFTDVFQIKPVSLIFESKVEAIKPDPFFLDETLHFFPTEANPEGFRLRYDLFASVFFFISRYEEWQDFEKDSHGRFTINQSLLFKHKSHLVPLVDLWIKEFEHQLVKFYPTLKLEEPLARIISSIDVDNLYAYKGKGILRSIGAFGKDLLKFDFRNFVNRAQVLFFGKVDPFDVYDEITLFCKSHQIPLLYFFLYRNGTEYDRTIEPGSRNFKLVLEKLKKQNCVIGLHPSYETMLDKKQLEKEIDALSSDLQQSILFSRQHFLRFNIRTTASLLLSIGVKVDFSMGYADEPGFRAGTSRPFYYYDFNKESASPLMFFPFCVMDGAYSIHRQISKTEILNELSNMAFQIKKTGGYFTTVFHERSFSDHLYPGFGSLYSQINLRIKEIFQSKN